MFDFLFEGGLTLYFALLIAAVFFFILWFKWRDRRFLKALGVVAGLALLVFLLDLLRETDRERALSTLSVVIERINNKQLDAAFSELSDDFQAYGMDKKTMREKATSAIRTYNIRNLRAKSIQVMKQDRDKRSVTLRFNATADSSLTEGWAMAPCEVDFVIDAQDRCRIKSFRIYRPVVDNVDPWDVFREF